jgi:hypothetical protein
MEEIKRKLECIQSNIENSIECNREINKIDLLNLVYCVKCLLENIEKNN